MLWTDTADSVQLINFKRTGSHIWDINGNQIPISKICWCKVGVRDMKISDCTARMSSLRDSSLLNCKLGRSNFDGDINRSTQHNSLNLSAVGSNPRVLRGLSFNCRAMALKLAWECNDKSVPWGRYCLNNRFLFKVWRRLIETRPGLAVQGCPF